MVFFLGLTAQMVMVVVSGISIEGNSLMIVEYSGATKVWDHVPPATSRINEIQETPGLKGGK